MTKKNRTIWLLGPQYHAPSLRERFEALDLPDGPIAVVTAGWQEREGEDEELDTYVNGRSLDLELYRRADHVFRSDPEFREAHREMQRTLREVEGLYDLRLSFVVESVRRLLVADGHRELLEPEQEHAIEQLRELDAWHLQRIVEIRTEFEQKWKPLERETIAHEREEVKSLLAKAPAVVITGGHVAVLLNRLRLFGMKELFEGKTLIAWSAGAMVLTERVVLFHDHPPQGRRPAPPALDLRAWLRGQGPHLLHARTWPALPGAPDRSEELPEDGSRVPVASIEIVRIR